MEHRANDSMPLDAAACGTAARAWFAGDFGRLHPLLQQLHTEGGVLQGPVDIALGRGLAGWIGRRLARKLGMPSGCARCQLQVTVAHRGRQLVWARRFTDAAGRSRDVVSVFEPHGHYPAGHWLERTGGLRFRLTVDVPDSDGSWHWRVLGAQLGGIPLPVGLFPRSSAYKRIEDGRYRFHVGFVMPGLGLLFSYSGLLSVVVNPEPETPAGSPRP